ncbi:MAG: phosphoribosyltransferase family protein [Nitrososphaeraceae archaeon]
MTKNERERRENIMTLGIPRGGVIVGNIVAKKLSSEFDIIIPRKLRAPHTEEVAIGAVMEDGYVYLNREIVRELSISQDYIEKEKSIQINEIKRRTAIYRNRTDTIATRIRHKNSIVLVDDGVATGATAIVTARWIKTINPNCLIIAVPIAPKDSINLLRKEANHIEVITSPSSSNFKSVGQYYRDFKPVTDEQVINIMKPSKEM